MVSDKVIIIAEAGVNHNGNLELARQMIREAHKAGADYVKFQTGVPNLIVSKYASKAAYQIENAQVEESQLKMLQDLALKLSDFRLLSQYCDEVDIKFLSTPFDLVSIDTLAELQMDYMKIPSGELTNLPYLRKIARLHIPVIMSTGMCRIGDIENALDVLTGNGLSKNEIILLHCNTEYPTPFADVNLRAMQTLAECFGVRVGYSDHTKGIEVPIAAVALGAKVIEKHFTLDCTLPGPDHKASLEPDELRNMVSAIRNTEEALGSSVKRVTDSEQKNISIARKSIVASVDMKAGDTFTENNITVKRPGNGISPMLWDCILGKQAIRDFGADELIEL